MTDFAQVEKYVQENKAEIINLLFDFSLHDTLLFWSTDIKLFALQNHEWNSVLSQFASLTGMRYETTTTIDEPKENEKHKNSFRDFLNTLFLKELTAVYLASTEIKSVICGICLTKGILSAEKAFDCAFLEESFQTQQWGMTEEISEKRQNIQNKLAEVENYVRNGSLS